MCSHNSFKTLAAFLTVFSFSRDTINVGIVSAFPSGAGACNRGESSVGGPHFVNAIPLTLSDGDFEVRLDGVLLVAGEESSSNNPIEPGVEHEIEVMGPSTFRGILIRIEGATDQRFSRSKPTVSTFLPGPGLGSADACDVGDDIVGVTHTSSEEKEFGSAIFTVERGSGSGRLGSGTSDGSILIDITIVTSLSPTSEYYYSPYKVAIQQQQQGRQVPDDDDDYDDDNVYDDGQGDNAGVVAGEEDNGYEDGKDNEEKRDGYPIFKAIVTKFICERKPDLRFCNDDGASVGEGNGPGNGNIICNGNPDLPFCDDNDNGDEGGDSTGEGDRVGKKVICKGNPDLPFCDDDDEGGDSAGSEEGVGKRIICRGNPDLPFCDDDGDDNDDYGGGDSDNGNEEDAKGPFDIICGGKPDLPFCGGD